MDRKASAERAAPRRIPASQPPACPPQPICTPPPARTPHSPPHAPRLACVDVPALPLQLLLRRHPDWESGPAAVVAEDSPQAPLLWVNESARRSGILPGMRHAAALAIDRRLRAGTVSPGAIAAAGERLHRHLLRYSPVVEAARHEPGVFWLDARGLERLHGSLEAWATRLHRSLARAGLAAVVSAGFTRFGSYALARLGRGVVVADTPARENALVHYAPLTRLILDPRLRDDLARLGVRTVGDLIALPADGTGARFGPAAAELHRLARGAGFAPLQPSRPRDPERAELFLEEPESDAWRLLFAVKRLLHPLLARLADRSRAVTALRLELTLADHERHRLRETLQTAAPTLDTVLLMELVRLRLERLELRAGVERVALTLSDTEAPATALHLFRRRPRRDPAAANRALARVRAELGDEAVVCAELRPGHLPESCFRWVKLPAPKPTPATKPTPAPIDRAPAAGTGTVPAADASTVPGAGTAPAAAAPLALVRRYLLHPRAVPPPPRALLRGGPFLVSGGWWRREVRRAYHFAAHESELRWVFYDARRRRWRLQGRVE